MHRVADLSTLSLKTDSDNIHGSIHSDGESEDDAFYKSPRTSIEQAAETTYKKCHTEYMEGLQIKNGNSEEGDEQEHQSREEGTPIVEINHVKELDGGPSSLRHAKRQRSSLRINPLESPRKKRYNDGTESHEDDEATRPSLNSDKEILVVHTEVQEPSPQDMLDRRGQEAEEHMSLGIHVIQRFIASVEKDFGIGYPDHGDILADVLKELEDEIADKFNQRLQQSSLPPGQPMFVAYPSMSEAEQKMLVGRAGNLSKIQEITSDVIIELAPLIGSEVEKALKPYQGLRSFVRSCRTVDLLDHSFQEEAHTKTRGRPPKAKMRGRPAKAQGKRL